MRYGTQPHDWKLGELEYAGIPCLVFSATEHGIFSGRWEIDLTLKEHRQANIWGIFVVLFVSPKPLSHGSCDLIFLLVLGQ
jgi:hypothetical protein